MGIKSGRIWALTGPVEAVTALFWESMSRLVPAVHASSQAS